MFDPTNWIENVNSNKAYQQSTSKRRLDRSNADSDATLLYSICLVYPNQRTDGAHTGESDVCIG
jgi:hypothetical protein